MEKENNDDIQVDSLAHRLNQLFKSIEIPEQVNEIEIPEDTWQAIRQVRKQEKKIKKLETKNLNLSEDYMKEYINIIEHSNSLRKEIEDSIEKVLSQHSTYYFQKLGVGSASIQSLKNPELRSKMNIDTLLRLLQRLLAKI